MSYTQKIASVFQNFMRHGHGRTVITTIQEQSDTIDGDSYFYWFKHDEKVARCITVNAGFATITAGFDTELEVIAQTPIGRVREEFEAKIKEKWKHLLDGVNSINAKVNLDTTLFYSVIFLYIFGKAAWLILPNPKTTEREPRKLLSFRVAVGETLGLQPVLNKEKEIEKYEDKDNPDEKTNKYPPEQILYFAYMDVTGTKQGLNSMDMILEDCKIRRSLNTKHYPKALERQWNAQKFASVDTSGYSDSEADTKAENELIKSLSKALNTGDNVAINKDITITGLTQTVDLVGMMQLEELKGKKIIGNFGTAPFLANELSANFATAHVEYDSYISGPIGNMQRFLKRELEANWYPHLMKTILKPDEYAVAVKEVKIKHVWRPAKKMSNVKEMVEIANMLYNDGRGILGDQRALAAETAGLAELGGKLAVLDAPTETTPV